MQPNSSVILLQLSLIEGVGGGTINFLLSRLGEKLNSLLSLSLAELVALGLPEKRAQLIWAGIRDDTLLKKELDLMDRHAVQWASCLDSAYPKRLLTIVNPPPIIYWQGYLPDQQKAALAVVGARAANHYGKQVVDQIVPQLVEAGAVIISGGALGADSMAHRAALIAGGQTVVVCGAGLLHYYPKSHQRLFEQILKQGGALISTYSMETLPMAGNFPARNRIIAGLSDGCLVVQAAAQSGARITALHAMEQGREVFVVPGLFGDVLSAGCHDLIQQGAKLVHSVGDILSDLIGIDEAQHAADQVNEAVELGVADLIMQFCMRPQTLTDLHAKLPDLDWDALQGHLFELQLQGRLNQNFAGLWVRGLT